MSFLKTLGEPWAVEQAKFQEIIAFYNRRTLGQETEWAKLDAKGFGTKDNPQEFGYRVINGTAIIPLQGVLAKKMNLMTQFSGGTSTQIVGQQFMEAMNSKEVRSILFDIDSPGGVVDGTQDLANQIYQGREKGKPIVAFVDGLMASAALWIGAAADRVIMSGETAQAGSIGVMTVHTDISRALEQRGIKETQIVSSKYKNMPSDIEPLSQEGRAYLQDRVNKIHQIFVKDVARFRGKDNQEFSERAANGDVFLGQEAIALGLADEMGTFNDTLADMKSVGFNRRKTFMSFSSDQHTHALTQFTDEQLKDVKAKAFAEGQEAGIKKAREEAQAELTKVQTDMSKAKDIGANEERARIQAIEEQAKGFPGHEDLIAKLKFDGKTTGDQAAVQILAAERNLKTKYRENLEGDAPPVVPQVTDQGKPSTGSQSPKDRDAVLKAYMNEDTAGGTESEKYGRALVRLQRENPELLKASR